MAWDYFFTMSAITVLFFLLIYRLHYGFYKIDLECGDKNAVKPTLAEVFLGIRKKKSEEKWLHFLCSFIGEQSAVGDQRRTAMSKTLLIELQQASLVLFNVACLYTPAFTGFFSETVPRKKLKNLNSLNTILENSIESLKLWTKFKNTNSAP